MRLTSRTARAMASAAAVALLVSGCSDDAGDQVNTTEGTPSPTATPSPTETPDGTGDQETSPGVTASDAVDQALETVDGDVVELELEDRTAWEVLVRGDDGSGTRVLISAESGDVTDERSEDVPEEVRDSAPEFTAKEAIDAALTAVSSSGMVTDVDIDREGDTLVWEVVVESDGAETDVQIDATSGEILTQERDD